MRAVWIICFFLYGPFVQAQGNEKIAILHVSIVDVVKGDLLKDQTVLLAGDRIVDIFPSTEKRSVKDYRKINARGKYLIPGLIDTHVHIHMFMKNEQKHRVPVALNMMVYHGVTGFREASGSTHTKTLIGLRDSLQSTPGPAPDMYVSGIATSTNLKHLNASTYTQLVQQFKKMGVDGIKVKFTTFEETKEIIDEAHKLRLPVYGHTANLWKNDSSNVLGDFTPGIVEHGIDGVMHTGGFPPIQTRLIPAPPSKEDWEASWLYMDAMWLYADNDLENALIRNMVKRGVWLEPTLVTEQLITARQQYNNDETLKYSFSTVNNFFEGFPKLTEAQMDTAVLAFKRKQAFVKKFYDAGGTVLAGTDLLYGSSLHRELELLSGAGLSPAEALKSATYHNAKALGWLEQLGTVEKGKRASLLLLDKNPLEDIRNTSSINTVFIRGYVLDGKERSKLLQRTNALVDQR
jgi:imidazolonepropionase-like amidohydrolase